MESGGDIIIYRFGAFELDLETSQLSKSGRRIRLAPQPLKLLTLLIAKAGRTLSRDEICGALWGDTVVNFETSLNACVRKLRFALNDPAESPRFIETLPRCGYRFVAPVEKVEKVEKVETVVPVAHRRRWPWAAAILAAAVALAWLSADRLAVPARPAMREQRIAVLPFQVLTGQSEPDRLGEALTDELIVRLTGLAPERLSVIARTSSARHPVEEPAVDFGKRLGVDFVLEGSIRKSGEKMRVSAKLIATENQEHVWGQTLSSEGDDPLGTQVRLSSSIAAGVASVLLPDVPAASRFEGPTVPRAFEAYFKGRYHLNRFDEQSTERAVTAFREAIQEAPDYARAHLGLAEAYNRLASQPSRAQRAPETYRLAGEAARRAIALEPDLAEAHLELALALWFADWDWIEAEKAFERALAINPGIAKLQHWYAYYLSSVGRHQESLVAVGKARELDPLSRAVNADVGLFYYFAGQPDRAVTECERTLELEPDYSMARLCLAEAHRSLGDFAEAAAEVRAIIPAEELSASEPLEVLTAFDRWRARPETGGPPYLKAVSLARLGEWNQAFVELDRAIAVRSLWVVVVDVDPSMKGLRRERGYRKILAGLKLQKPLLAGGSD